MGDAAPKRIVLSVSGSGVYMKFSPVEAGDIEDAFEVDTEVLRNASQLVRDAVEKLCRLYCQAGSRRPAESKVLLAVRKIAQHGRELWAAIFRSATLAEQLAKRIETENLHVTFAVSHSVRVHAPYGLMFGGLQGPYEIEELEHSELMPNFWRQKHEVSVVYSINDQIPLETDFLNESAPLHAEGTKVFGVFHPKAVKYALDERQISWPESAIAYSARDFKARWRTSTSDYNMLYFFCHANGEVLHIGTNNDSLVDDLLHWQLKSLIPDRRNQPLGGLIILNGCETAASSGRGKWLEATRTCGFAGFIGTEAMVPTRFAWPFGNDLIKMILSEEKTALQALKILWKQHWPLSLLYSLYCIADVRVRPAMTTDYLQRVQHTNYSELTLSDVAFGEEQYSTLPFSRAGKAPVSEGEDEL